MDSVKINKKSFFTRIAKRVTPITILAMILGAMLGQLFYHYTNCCAGDMTIHVNQYISIFYGLLFGASISYKSSK